MARYPRWLRNHHQRADIANVAHAIREAGDRPDTDTKTYIPTPADKRRIRGIPVAAPGIPGTIPGTQPHQALDDNR
jgi:hypothetical protein